MNKFSHFTILVTFLCLSLVGLSLIPMLPIKLSPSRSLPQLTVSFLRPGFSARSIETEITCKLEAMLSRISGIKEIESTSDNNRGSIRISLDKHTPIDMARFEIASAIRQLYPELPGGVSYPTLQLSNAEEQSSRPFMSFTVNAPANPITIQQYTEEQIKTRLSSLKGINKIEVHGATPLEWRLTYDSDQLSALGISLRDIEEVILNYYTKAFIGVAVIHSSEEGSQWIGVQLVPQQENVGFVASDITVRTPKGILVSLDRLIKVEHIISEPLSYYRINGLNSIYLNIFADDFANQLELSKRVYTEIDAIKAALPLGFEIFKAYDATEYIHKELNTIYLRTGLTVFILLLFVLLITRNWKYLLLISLSLSINISVALIFYYLFRLEIQLYSLAGITISLSLIIDNTIVMSDHLLRERNMKVFLSILAATLTSIGALVIIFFLDEKIRLNLQDFAAVVIINLAVSLIIALFLVPALIDKIGITKRSNNKSAYSFKRIPFLRSQWRNRLLVRFNRIHAWQIGFLTRWRVMSFIVLALIFGIPLFMLPEKIDKKEEWQQQHPKTYPWVLRYNEAMANPFYKETIKPIISKALGGTLRLFVEKVYNGSYFSRKDEVVLYVNANLPNGSTLSQMNTLMQKMEDYLLQFGEIRQFQTSIYSPMRAGIQVYFIRSAERSGFPYVLKSNIISKALELGGGSWGVYGLEDQGFSNDVRETAGSYQIELYGYNYDELYEWADKLRKQLLENRRIKEVIIASEFSWWKDDYREFYFDLNREWVAHANLTPMELFNSLNTVFGRDRAVGSIIDEGQVEQIKLSSLQSSQYDVWSLLQASQIINEKSYKIEQLARMEMGQMPPKIARINQQYRLCVQYEYIGAQQQGTKVQERILESFSNDLPMGYSAKKGNSWWSWGKEDGRQYLLLALIIVIIYFVSSILFNSLRQAFIIVFIIPVSFIGVFLAFYLFKVNFDQGGFASLILLCGITVNSSIYLVSQFNSIRQSRPLLSPIRAYVKAWNIKITPILLTVLSTILGFVPFMIGQKKEAFWFPLSVGTIGGLITSVIGIYLYLSIMVVGKKKRGADSAP